MLAGLRAVLVSPASSVVLMLLCAVALLWCVSPASAAFPGENGRIAYTAWKPDDGPNQIFTVRANGTGNRRLMGANAFSPAWSADGRYILFTRQRRNSGIWTMRADGSSPTRVVRRAGTGVSTPGWAPDGQRIVFESEWGEDRSSQFPWGKCGWSGPNAFILVAGIDGAGATQLRECAKSPAWSPDGQQIAFLTFDCNDRPGGVACGALITMMKADGTDSRVVARLARATFDRLDFSPDGRKLLFVQPHSHGTRPRVVDVQSGRIQTLRVAGNVTHAVWAPDGRRIAYALWPPPESPPRPTRPTEIWTMRPDGTDQRRIFTLPRDLLSAELSWQPRP